MAPQEPSEPAAAAAPATPPVAGETPEPDVVAQPRPAEPAADLGALLKRAEDEVAELKDAWLRARADLENVRKQGANDLARAHKYAIERFARDLLQVKDSLELALSTGNAAPDALRAGVELTLKQLAAAFDKAEIAEDDPRGQKFDPHRHEAMTTVESTEPANTVVQVFQKGYQLHDRVLRPALVAVARAKEGQS